VDRRVVRALGLTAEQEEKVEEIVIKHEPEYAVQVSDLIGAGKDADPKGVADLLDRNGGECLKLLTADQKAAWGRLTGPKLAIGAWVRAVAPVLPESPGAIRIGGAVGGGGGGVKIVVPAAGPGGGGIVVPQPGGVVLPAKPGGME
jgi:hypothetical protein